MTHPKMPSTSALWPDPERGPFELKFRFALVDSQIECVGMSLTSESDPVTTSLVRSLNLSSMIAEHKQAIFEEMRSNGDDLDLPTDEPGETGQPGRKRLPSAHYARVARIYAEAHLAGRNPSVEVAERLQMSRPTAVKQIARARDYGFLEPTEKGRAGGIPEDLAHRVLNVIELDHLDASPKFHDITIAHEGEEE